MKKKKKRLCHSLLVLFHKRRDLELLVALSGMELVFLPPYSPELNAIEEF